jgi:hypothetical protein
LWYNFLISYLILFNKNEIMKKVFLALIVGGSLLYACGTSSSTTGDSDTPVNVSSSPTGDTAITDGGTGAAKGAETTPDTTTTTMPTDSTTTNPADSTTR